MNKDFNILVLTNKELLQISKNHKSCMFREDDLFANDDRRQLMNDSFNLQKNKLKKYDYVLFERTIFGEERHFMLYSNCKIKKQIINESWITQTEGLKMTFNDTSYCDKARFEEILLQYNMRKFGKDYIIFE